MLFDRMLKQRIRMLSMTSLPPSSHKRSYPLTCVYSAIYYCQNNFRVPAYAWALKHVLKFPLSSCLTGVQYTVKCAASAHASTWAVCDSAAFNTKLNAKRFGETKTNFDVLNKKHYNRFVMICTLTCRTTATEKRKPERRRMSVSNGKIYIQKVKHIKRKSRLLFSFCVKLLYFVFVLKNFYN